MLRGTGSTRWASLSSSQCAAAQELPLVVRQGLRCRQRVNGAANVESHLLAAHCGEPTRMLIEFDQNTMANMTAALEAVCKKLPRDKDNHETRKSIADAIVASAKAGRQTYIDFECVGFKVLQQNKASPRSNRFGFRCLSYLMSWFR